MALPFNKGGQQAQQTFNTTAKDTGTLEGRGASTFNGMMPTLLSDAAGKGGLTPGQKATMDTAAQQSTGGSTAGITGQADLAAGRTGNPGSMIAGIGSASRGNARNLSNDALETQEYSTNMAQQKQQAALGELGKLYGTNVSGLNDMIKNQNQATSNITTAGQDQFGDIMAVGKMVGGMGLSGAGMAGMGPGGGASALSAGSGMMG